MERSQPDSVVEELNEMSPIPLVSRSHFRSSILHFSDPQTDCSESGSPANRCAELANVHIRKELYHQNFCFKKVGKLCSSPVSVIAEARLVTAIVHD
jgi:hypothetical protein